MKKLILLAATLLFLWITPATAQYAVGYYLVGYTKVGPINTYLYPTPYGNFTGCNGMRFNVNAYHYTTMYRNSYMIVLVYYNGRQILNVCRMK